MELLDKIDKIYELLEKTREEILEKSSGYKEWEPQDGYDTEEQADAVQNLIEQGYTHREAEHMALDHPIPPMDVALQHKIHPSQPSEKHLQKLKELAREYIANHDKHIKANAELEKNPMLHTEGKISQLHEDRTKHFSNAYHNFLNSDEVKNLQGRDHFKAVQAWKNKYHQEHPEYHQNLIQDSGTVKEHAQKAQQYHASNVQDKIQQIISGGGAESSVQSAVPQAGEGTLEEKLLAQKAKFLEAGDVKRAKATQQSIDALKTTTSEETEPSLFSQGLSSPSQEMTIGEAAQHVGGGEDKEEGPRVSTVQDPLSAFAQQNPEFVKKQQKLHELFKQHGTPQQQDAFKRINAAKMAAGHFSQPKTPQPVQPAPVQAQPIPGTRKESETGPVTIRRSRAPLAATQPPKREGE
jgi:hypothetical protein